VEKKTLNAANFDKAVTIMIASARHKTAISEVKFGSCRRIPQS